MKKIIRKVTEEILKLYILKLIVSTVLLQKLGTLIENYCSGQVVRNENK